MQVLHEACAVILVGHGAPPKDVPRELVSRLKALEGRRSASGGSPSAEELELDRQIRTWPRTEQTDPYQAGLSALAAALAPKLAPARLHVAYNEFCAPSLREAVELAIGQGAREVRVLSTMLTPGGIHASVEIPEAVNELSREHPAVVIRYLWPFDLDLVAALLAAHVNGATAASGA